MVTKFIGFLLLATISFAQLKDDLAFIIDVNPINMNVKQEVSDFTFKEVSELKLISTGLIRFYQIFISTQDIPACNFTLSCSHFASKAIKKYGLFFGLLMASDRLQRCNGVGKVYYPVDLETGLAIDYPIENYFWDRSKNKTTAKE